MSFINRKSNYSNSSSIQNSNSNFNSKQFNSQFNNSQSQFNQQYKYPQLLHPTNQFGQQPQFNNPQYKQFNNPQSQYKQFSNPQFNNSNSNSNSNSKQFNPQFTPQSQPRIRETIQSNIVQKVKEIKEEDKPVITGKFKNMTSDEIINLSYTTFKEIYKNRVKKTKIESIINGEMLTTCEDNIFVDTTTFEDPGFENKLQLCKKKLYKYQIESIKMIRQLELSETFKTSKGETIRTNGILLHLPIGSGKTIVFMFITLIYRDIPPKPIVISTSGIHIPEDKMIQLKFYPFYYENVGYIEGKENCVVCVKDYIQRKITVIITHLHLIDQLIDYIHSDFVPGIYNPQVNKIVVATSPKQIDLNCNVLIVPAKPEIIDRLSMLSCEQPFMRVVVDDYTNMPNIEQYRQIRATSTIFVSGSGFERDIEKIPPSYYTLRHIEVDKYSLVAKAEETSEGITRSNVVTFNLVGAQNEFSIYKFVNEIDEHCMNKYSMVASNLYSQIVKNGGKLLDYLNLNFILKNYDKLNKSISLILSDIENEKLPKEKVEWFLKWKDIINQKSKVIVYKNKTKTEEEVDNPLYNSLFKPINQVPQGIQPMFLMNCSVCGKLPQEHKGWGFISSCCGSFFCADCAKSMVTRDLVIYPENCRDSNNVLNIHDNEHYYCVVCHKFDPTYVSNSTRHKDMNNIQTYQIVNDYMDSSELKNHLHIDYYFKMFIDGFKPKYFDGKVIECEVETKIWEGIDKFKSKIHEIIEQLIPKDQLALSCIERINECLKRLEIYPAKMNTIKPQLLIYGCPDYMQKRVEQYFKAYSNDNTENLYSLNILFKNSLSELIGLHQNILGILVWNNPKHVDEIQQLIGRIVRLNNWNNPVYFYITCTGGVDERGEEIENVNNADNVETKKLGLNGGRMIENIVNENVEENVKENEGNMLDYLKSQMSVKVPELINKNMEAKNENGNVNGNGIDFGF